MPYNGWVNYETWRVNVDVVDGMTSEDFGFNTHDLATDDYENTEKLAEALEIYTVETVSAGVPKGLALDLAMNFLDKVDWEQIASQMIRDSKATADLTFKV